MLIIQFNTCMYSDEGNVFIVYMYTVHTVHPPPTPPPLFPPCSPCSVIDKQDGVRLLWSLLKSPNLEVSTVCEKYPPLA